MVATADKIEEAFDDLGFEVDDPKVKDKLCSLCEIHGIDEDKMSCEYLAYLSRKKMAITTCPTAEILDDFDLDLAKHLQGARQEKKRIADVTGQPVHDAESLLADEDEALDFYSTSKKRQVSPASISSSKRLHIEDKFPFSPTSFPSTPKSSISGSGKTYSSRTNAGKIMIRFGDETLGSSSSWKNAAPFEAKVKILSAKMPENYRFMFERLRQRAGHLDETICRVGDHLINSLNLEPQSFNRVIPEPFDSLGRVCCDADGRLNAKSILLQGSMDLCGGKTVRLDPSGVKEYSLFPGQIVHARAANPGNKLVTEVINADASPEAAADHNAPDDMQMVVASGPYSTSDNFKYEPLADLLKYVRDHRPHAVVLCGPFVDVRHPMVESGDCDLSFDQIFEQVVLKMIESCAKEATLTRFIVVPSYRDVHHKYVYPTPPFPSLSHLENVIMTSDPSTISIEGLKIGVTSTDILFHLGKEEISFPPRSGDRLRRLATHLIQQRSFYPLYPPGEDINIDLEQLEKVAVIEDRPHLLILPSDLLHFFKDVGGGCAAVNPQRLAKGEGGGVFARVKIQKNKLSGEIIRI